MKSLTPRLQFLCCLTARFKQHELGSFYTLVKRREIHLSLVFALTAFQTKKCADMFICKQRKCLSPEHWVAHSRGVCPGTATHSYVMPYLQSADHMHFQIPNWNYWHYHNHLDTHTAGRASQLADCVQSRAKTPAGWAQDMYCSTYSLPVKQTLYYLITRAVLTQTYRASPI